MKLEVDGKRNRLVEGLGGRRERLSSELWWWSSHLGCSENIGQHGHGGSFRPNCKFLWRHILQGWRQGCLSPGKGEARR